MPWNQTWDNNDINTAPSFMPTYNMNMNANMEVNTNMNMEYMYNNMQPGQGIDDNWNAFIDEHPEYASLDPFAVVLLSLCSPVCNLYCKVYFPGH